MRKSRFGAKLVKHGNETVGEIPGANILFAKATGPVVGTKGRAFDRIGLEVKNVEELCKNFEAAGIKLDTGYRKAASMNLAVCVLTDPLGEPTSKSVKASPQCSRECGNGAR